MKQMKQKIPNSILERISQLNLSLHQSSFFLKTFLRKYSFISPPSKSVKIHPSLPPKFRHFPRRKNRKFNAKERKKRDTFPSTRPRSIDIPQTPLARSPHAEAAIVAFLHPMNPHLYASRMLIREARPGEQRGSPHVASVRRSAKDSAAINSSSLALLAIGGRTEPSRSARRG